MIWKRLVATKSLEMLHAEAEGENRLRRILGPIGLTSLGVGAIIGAGIFVMTGEVAANHAGPGILLSFVVAGVACALAAFCYAEFAAMAPVAGSAYTYAYATLGELFAWIIGWDLILEYAMSAATVAASWSKYFNKFLEVCFGFEVPSFLCNDPFSSSGAWFNLPAVAILFLCTTVLVIGIRESAASNTALVLMKLGVVLFVIAAGVGYVNFDNYTTIPPEERRYAEDMLIPSLAEQMAKDEELLVKAAEAWSLWFAAGKKGAEPKVEITAVTAVATDASRQLAAEGDAETRMDTIKKHALALFHRDKANELGNAAFIRLIEKRIKEDLPEPGSRDEKVARAVVKKARAEAPNKAAGAWGLLGILGLNEALAGIDNATRSNFMPYGLSGIMLGAALVFFAYIGFDSISTHSEEAIKPQRDVPFGILASLAVCTVLYMAVAAVITGMVPYYEIDTDAAVASAFTDQAKKSDSWTLHIAGGLIAAGALAGMTSVLLITFLSQARIFLAMARDGLMPRSVFGAVHAKFRTPHISTMVTGGIMCVVAAFTPIRALEEMVNIGTLFAFEVVCAAVLILRIKRPEAHRPFRCPFVYVVAPLGIFVNLALMLFLPVDTWLRLVIWLFLGLCIYFSFGYHYSALREKEISDGTRPAAQP